MQWLLQPRFQTTRFRFLSNWVQHDRDDNFILTMDQMDNTQNYYNVCMNHMFLTTWQKRKLSSLQVCCFLGRNQRMSGTGPQQFTSAVRETDASRHDGEPQLNPSISRTVTWCSMGFRRSIYKAPMMLRDASLSDGVRVIDVEIPEWKFVTYCS